MSDIDQSSANTEDDIAAVIQSHIRWFQTLDPDIIVLKCQYSFGTVLQRLMIRINDMVLRRLKYGRFIILVH